MSDKSFLSSNSLLEHLLRGIVGIGVLWYALRITDQSPWLSLAFGVVALIAFRGCPICWTMGLIETIYRRVKSKLSKKSSNDSVATE